MAYIRLTDPAVADLERILKLDPSILRRVFAKMLLLEKNTMAGEPLLGELMGWRKITVGDRNWRIIWRATKDETVGEVIEVAQVWAIGARSDSEIYEEMKNRIANSPTSPRTHAIADFLKILGDKVGKVKAATEPVDSPAPKWLLDRLEFTVGYSRDEIRGFSVEQAMELWDEYTREK